MPFKQYPSQVNLDTIALERRGDVFAVDKLERGKAPGRIVTLTRAVPMSATDVAAGDGEGDEINDATTEYKLKNIAGVLKWAKITQDTGW